MNIYVYIAAMALTTYLIRMLPLTISVSPSAAGFSGPSSTTFPMPA